MLGGAHSPPPSSAGGGFSGAQPPPNRARTRRPSPRAPSAPCPTPRSTAWPNLRRHVSCTALRAAWRARVCLGNGQTAALVDTLNNSSFQGQFVYKRECYFDGATLVGVGRAAYKPKGHYAVYSSVATGDEVLVLRNDAGAGKTFSQQRANVFGRYLKRFNATPIPQPLDQLAPLQRAELCALVLAALHELGAVVQLLDKL